MLAWYTKTADKALAWHTGASLRALVRRTEFSDRSAGMAHIECPRFWHLGEFQSAYMAHGNRQSACMAHRYESQSARMAHRNT